MNSLFHYLYKCNKKSIAILYFVFIAFSLLLLFHVKGSLKIMNSFRQDITLAIFLILLCMALFSIFLLALSSFNKTIKNSMIRYTAISSQRNIYANLFFFTLVFIILLVIGLIFLYYFSLSANGEKVTESLQQEFYMLYEYGIFHHVFAVFSWGIDFIFLLVSGYFIIVITKQFPVKESVSKILFFIIFFAVFVTIQTVVMDVLSRLEKYVVTIKNNEFIDQNGFIDTSFYPSEWSTITDLGFSCLLIIFFVTITGRIIDKKLEI
ncbi:ABC transporter permease [Bacillus wiedmannii]|uniref:ABC transporter permease n=1 Tax=Bacillus wiedmannii TaxID=1890302 RepID=UPI000D03AD01|nr:ABC transporter permease [Bacillus wiedmannii]PRT27309.1 ABC transporter permease [Bacillus wiedmannii]PRT38544.1 ABC transporter permease [Bacillus wiedmannii]